MPGERYFSPSFTIGISFFFTFHGHFRSDQRPLSRSGNISLFYYVVVYYVVVSLTLFMLFLKALNIYSKVVSTTAIAISTLNFIQDLDCRHGYLLFSLMRDE